MVPHPKTPILNWLYHLLWVYVLTVSALRCLAKSYSLSGLTPLPHIPNQLHFIEKRVHMKCLMLIRRQESCQVSHKNHLFYPFLIESLYLSLLLLFAALL